MAFIHDTDDDFATSDIELDQSWSLADDVGQCEPTAGGGDTDGARNRTPANTDEAHSTKWSVQNVDAMSVVVVGDTTFTRRGQAITGCVVVRVGGDADVAAPVRVNVCVYSNLNL